MTKSLRAFYNIPHDKSELLEFERLGFLFVTVVFFFTSALVFFVIFHNFNLDLFYKNMNLGIVMVFNGVAYLAFSRTAHYFSKEVLKIKLILELEKIIRNFWSHYLFMIGIQYLSLALRLYLDHDFSSAVIMFSIFIGSLMLAYIVDWRNFQNLKDKYSTFFAE